MKLKDLFVIKYGQREYHSKGFIEGILGDTPLISSSGINNGFYGRFNIKPKYKKVISVANTGSVGWAFYHPYDCCIDDNCLVLEPLKEMSDGEMIFITLLINKDRYRYMYGRQVTPLRIGEIKLPEVPSYVKNKELKNIKTLKNRLIKKKLSLKPKQWRWFDVTKVFDEITIAKSTDLNTLSQSDEGGIPYVGRSRENNGITAFIKKENTQNLKTLNKKNCLSVAMVGDSTCYAFWQKQDFIASQNILILRSKMMNVYSALFISNIIFLEKYRFSYGRTLSKSFFETIKIKLPTSKENKPDWKFMEHYIKSLPYSASI